MFKSGAKHDEEGREFVLDPTLRLRFGFIECNSITICSSGPIFQKFGCEYIGTFYKVEHGYRAGRPIFQNNYGKSLTMINIFGKVQYWTVHDVVPVEQKSEGLYNNISPQMQCFRLNLRRNICPALARGSDKFFLYKTLGMAESKIMADNTMAVTCHCHSH